MAQPALDDWVVPPSPTVAAPAAGVDDWVVPGAASSPSAEPATENGYAVAPRTPVAPPAAPTPPPEGSLGHRLGLGVRDVVEGVAGPLYDIAGAPLRAAGLPVHTLSENLDALGMPTANTPGERMSSAIIRPVAGTMTGMGAGSAMTGAASPIVRSIGEALTAQPVTQAVSAGVGGATTEATGSPTLGLLAAMATPSIGSAIGHAISPDILANTPERAGFRATAAQEDIPLTLAQQTGGKVARNFESTLANLPGSSGKQAGVNAAQQEAWNAAVLRRAGIDATSATPEVLNAGKRDLGAVFNDLTSRNTLTADPQFAGDLAGVKAEVARYAAPGVKEPILNRIEDIENATQSGTMEGRAYQEHDSALGKQIRSATDGNIRQYLGDLRDTLRGAMDRSISPEDQAAWRDVRTKYANLQTIAKAMDRPTEGTAMGDISPAALAQASRNQASKSFAFGRGNLDDLARLGQGALKQTTPDSGTAQRTMMANLVTGKSLYPALAATGVSGNPLFLAAPVAELAGPRVAAGVYHSNALSRYLTNDMAAGITPKPNALLAASIASENQAQRLREAGPRINPLLH